MFWASGRYPSWHQRYDRGVSDTPKPRRARNITDEGEFVLDLLGRRWLPRIIWELGPGAQSFGELRRRCDSMSTSVLSQRLRDLAEAGMAQTDDFGAWELTGPGQRVATQLDVIVDRCPPAPRGS